MVPATYLLCMYLKVNILYVKKEERFMLATRCLWGIVGSVLGFWGYHYISLGKGMLIFNLGPLIQTLFGWAFLGESISSVDIIAPSLVLTGVGYMIYMSDKMSP